MKIEKTQRQDHWGNPKHPLKDRKFAAVIEGELHLGQVEAMVGSDHAMVRFSKEQSARIVPVQDMLGWRFEVDEVPAQRENSGAR